MIHLGKKSKVLAVLLAAALLAMLWPGAVFAAAPTITAAVMDPNNVRIQVTFSEGIYTNSDGTGGVTADDFNLSFQQNGSTVSNVTTSGPRTLGNSDPIGGETSFFFYLDLTNGPATGVETVEIKPKDGASVYNAAREAMAADATTGAIKLFDKRVDFAPTYPKAGSVQAAGSKQAQLVIYPLNETVTAYYVVVANGAAAPSAAQVMAGKDSTDGEPLAKGTHPNVNTGGIDISVILPEHATDYDAWVVIEDSAGNTTGPVKADLRTPDAAPANNVCEIVGGTQYATLNDALAAVTSGQTIRLLKDVSHASKIEAGSKSFIIDVSGFKLTVNVSGDDCISAINGQSITIKDNTGGGSLEVNGSGMKNGYGITGLYADGAGSAINVTLPATINVTGQSNIGVDARGKGVVDAKFTDVNNSAGSGYVYGVIVYEGGTAHVGNIAVAPSGNWCIGVYVYGDALSDGQTTATVDGIITADEYIRMGPVTVNMANEKLPTTKTGYRTYKLDNAVNANTVWIKIASMTDAEKVAADKAALTFDAIKNQNANTSNITGNLATLPATGVNGSRINWSSSDPSTISSSGSVTRPANGTGDKTVTLTATITSGAVSDTVVFSLTVKEMTHYGGGGGGPTVSDYVQEQYIHHNPDQATVDLTKSSTKLSAAQMSVLIADNKTKPVILSGDNFTITFEKGTMTTVQGQGDYDFGVTFNTGTNYNKMKELSGRSFALMLSFSHSGKLPAVAAIKIKVGTQYAGKVLYDYYFNPATGGLEYTQSTIVDKDGYTVVKQSHCSDYVFLSEALLRNTPVTGIKRFAGSSRIDTALEIARANYPGKVANVILATADNYPDALAGSVLAYKLQAPILLVGRSEADQQKILSYLKSNMDTTGTVYILGGTGAVDSGMEGKLAAAGFSKITRMNGNDRYETAAKIADNLEIKTGTAIVLVNGENYADALSISSMAAVMQNPVLPVQKEGISDAVKKKIAQIKPTRIYIIGLEGVISAAVEEQAAGIASLDKANIIRIAGADRYQTSLKVAQYFNLSGPNICVATGRNFPDALAGSLYAANANAPILLVDAGLSAQGRDDLTARKVTGAVIFGGEGAVSKSVEQELLQLLVK
jgi:putative cell wall-binding protein